jgi:TonB family protein
VEKIGPYNILGELGRGGMGVVYRGVDPVIGRHVAIKTLRPEDMGEASERGSMGDRLLREARSAGMLSHPSIVTIYQAGQDGDILYIAMEFIDGANLADILAQGRLTTDATLKILRNAADALDYAHSKGVVHRDIKPGNLLLEPSGKVKIADFGIAKLNQAGVTKTTSSVGSPAYMSPEHVRAQSIDGRADQYSLGVVAYEMITGRRPHDSEELTSLVFKVVFEPPDLSLLDAHPKGSELLPVFSKVLAKASEDRYGSCVEFCEVLAAALEGTAVPATPAQSSAHTGVEPTPTSVPPSHANRPEIVPDSVPPPGESKKGLLLGGGALLVALLAIGGYSLSRPPKEVPEQTKTGEQQPQSNPTKAVAIEKPTCYAPEDPALAKIHGTVVVDFQISVDGLPQNLTVKQSLHPGLDRYAMDCISKYRFQPATTNGKDPRVSTGQQALSF